MSAPYTHRDHAAVCASAARAGHSVAGLHVQARIGRTICCARIVTAWDTPDGVEMWQLDLYGPIHGRRSTPTRNVRQCALVDGRCSCSPAPQGRAETGQRLAATEAQTGPEGVTC